MAQPRSTFRIVSDRSDPASTTIEPIDQPADPKPGEVILRLDLFALTSNNITYAAFGDAMRYWDFFPTGAPGKGLIPVWGFADVVASGVDGIEAGERFYGYFPMTSHVRMQPERVTPRGFYDGAAHRRDLTSAYNQYTRCSADPAYAADREAFQALFRPLFLTSFMLADYLQDRDFFGARRILFSSASSKTTYGTAYCLGATPGVERVGLTSPRNRGFVSRIGCYDSVATYAEVEDLDPTVPTVYVDFSGDDALRQSIHRHLGEALRHDCYAGSSANSDFLREVDLPGPKPEFYFAPNQIRKRNADWGHAVLAERTGAAQERFFADAGRATPPWVTIRTGEGPQAAARIVALLAKDGGDPAEGHIVRFGRTETSS